MNFEQMEEIKGGASTACALAVGGALVFGMGGLIAAAGSGGLGIGFAIAANYWAWGTAAATCAATRVPEVKATVTPAAQALLPMF